jgi:hypothetical protein
LQKSRQPLDLPKKQGGYGHVRTSSSRGHESLDHGSITHHPSNLIRVTQGLFPREQSKNPKRNKDIEASGFGKSGVTWTRSRGNPS